VLDVGREEDSGDVGLVGLEMGDWDEGSLFAVLEKMPYVDVALYSMSVESHEVDFMDVPYWCQRRG
jgi:hypothetical protein